MIKNVIALVSLTALTGLAVSVAAVGCSSSDGDTSTDTDGGKEGGSNKPPVTKGDGGDDDDGGGSEIQGHSGLPCTGEADCQADGDDDHCSKGAFVAGDIFPTPVCFDQNPCTIDPNNFGTTVFCDEGTGVCDDNTDDADPGQCWPGCLYDATGIQQDCAGNNKCLVAHIVSTTDDKLAVLGICLGGCTKDEDCEGTAGQKCQVESGICVKPEEYVTYAKKIGETCADKPAGETQDCLCLTVNEAGAPDEGKGICSSRCFTGAAGDAACGAGWTCSTLLPSKDDEGGALFSGQPDGVGGLCVKSCTSDADCAGLTTGTTAMTCQEVAGGKVCLFPTK